MYRYLGDTVYGLTSDSASAVVVGVIAMFAYICIWYFPTKRDPNIDPPNTVVLLYRDPQRSP